jgi:hypothetical protein
MSPEQIGLGALHGSYGAESESGGTLGQDLISTEMRAEHPEMI